MELLESRSDIRSKFIAASPAEVFAAVSAPDRIARWWGPNGFASVIHKFDFVPGGQWLLTMTGPDGAEYPNELRFVRLVPGEVFEIEHLSGHHFFLALTLSSAAGGTQVHWRQTFDSVAHYQSIAQFVSQANEQNLERLAHEVEAGSIEVAHRGDAPTSA
jgi:uncharacterized protein YndB with AHSA1/START domain